VKKALRLLAEARKPKQGKGNCFQVAADYVMDEGLRGRKDLILVHGVVTGQGPIKGLKFSHAWVEDGEDVIDKSNGRDLQLNKRAYYALGRVGLTIPYTYEETRKWALKTGIYGPWEDLGVDI